jgi:uncharacterized membrane protein
VADSFDRNISVAVRNHGFGIIASLWYGVARENWTKDEYLLISLAVIIPVLFTWFLLERLAWNYDLHRKGISSNSDVWSINQFPRKSIR